MKKKCLKMLSFLLLISTLIVTISSCQSKSYFTDIFEYKVIKHLDYDKKVACIYDFTDYGKSLEYVVLPDEFDGYPLAYFYYPKVVSFMGMGPTVVLSNKTIKKLYVPFRSELLYYDIAGGYFSTKGSCPNLQIIFFTEPGLKCFNEFWYFCEEEPNAKNGIFITYNLIDVNVNVSIESNIANVTYFYNYKDNIDDDIYFADNYINDLIDYIPDDPIREGYKFAGWYKEKECLNKWDFKTDKTGDFIDIEPEVNEDGYFYISEENIQKYSNYTGTKLYAKWEEI